MYNICVCMGRDEESDTIYEFMVSDSGTSCERPACVSCARPAKSLLACYEESDTIYEFMVSDSGTSCKKRIVSMSC